MDAIFNEIQAMLIVATAATVSIQQPAAYIGVIGLIGRFFFLKLVEAAAAAAIAEAFPLRIIHFAQGLASPKWNLIGVIGITCHGVLRAP